MNFVFINGQQVSENEAKLSIFSRALQFGEGLFETILIHKGKLIFLNEHLDRLFQSIDYFHFQRVQKQEWVADSMVRCLQETKVETGIFKVLFLPSGTKEGFSKDPTHFDWVFLIKIQREFLNQPVSLMTFFQPFRSALAYHKTIQVFENSNAFRMAQKQGFHDALFVYQGTFVLETTKANIFFLRGEELITPSLKFPLLNGIVRQKVLKIAKQQGIRALEKKIKVKEIEKFEIGFVTNSLIGLLPLSKIDSFDYDFKSTIFHLIKDQYLGFF